MKRVFAVVTLAALALLWTNSTAEAQRTMTIGISGGISVPTGDMGDFQRSGFHVGGQLNFAPPALPVEIMLDGTYHMFEANPDNSDAVDFTYFSLNANAAYLLPGVNLRPYLLGGVGMYFGKADVAGAESDNEFGFNFGAGLRFLLTGMSTFLQARIHFVDDDAFIPVSFGIIF